MPEMPEVETMTGRLQRCVGLTIQSATNTTGSDRYLPGGDIEKINGQKINGVYRRGKFIVFMLDKGGLLCHNAMSGYWDSTDSPWTFDYVEGDRSPGTSDIRATITLANPEAPLLTAHTARFHDARKFGSLKYLNAEDLAVKLSAVGPEVLSWKYSYEPIEVIAREQFGDVFKKVKKPIKVALMEQNRVAGLGNIYAAEACWIAKIDPRKMANSLTTQQFEDLHEACRGVLEDAMNRKLDYSGLKIYRRRICPVCRSDVQKEKLAGRSTYFCPSCQK